MRTQEQVEAELETLKQELSQVEGTPTEVYTRIVGYYRSVNNWNKGKREEYRFRKLFHAAQVPAGRIPDEGLPIPGTQRAEAPDDAAADYSLAAEAGIDYYFYFYRTTCPNCQPVKNYIVSLPIKGRQLNVDEPEGLALAAEYQVLASPTVIFFDVLNREIYRAHNVQSLKEIARFAGIKREPAPV
ncbi:MAG: hypothetical protein E4H36_09780 [Spirochaetales bacterium]|nr:MAG: hypothetical protein E4H36_09780 [Spirochaetales bacterium]